MGKRGWHINEEIFLIENYAKLTIKELQKCLYDLSGGMRKERSADSINAKIKRLKSERRIVGQKNIDTVNRSLIQRRKDI